MQPDEVMDEALAIADEAFTLMTYERHKMGEKKYGPVKFLEIDSIEMALEEIADLANYAKYTFMKLFLLRMQLEVQNKPEPSPLGADAVTNPYGS